MNASLALEPRPSELRSIWREGMTRGTKYAQGKDLIKPPIPDEYVGDPIMGTDNTGLVTASYLVEKAIAAASQGLGDTHEAAKFIAEQLPQYLRHHLSREKMPPGRRIEILERDAYRCQVCDDHRDLVVDHIIPVAMGGSNDPANLQALCGPCNMKKGARLEVGV